MNNTVENYFFGFPKVQWLYPTGEVDICKIFMSNFLRISHVNQCRLIFDRVI